MRHLILVVILAATVVGCAHSGQNPLVPVAPGGDQIEPTDLTALAVDRDGPYRLWWEGFIYIDAAHERVDVVPRRDMHFHLNALKFLEEYCKNCLQITGIKNNGDSTIDLTVKITHPFKGFPQYTGFDVKGIIMFDGSWENPGDYKFLPWPEPFRVSWRGLGDPQVLNADGYTLRWSPWYDSGLPQPIFNYWRGRHASGTPTANLNAYLDFYTHEARHMFADYGSVSRTYHVWLPPGPVVAAYAVEACWEPPTKKPVTNPIVDFPLSANQSEPYKFYFDLNNGEPITEPGCCGDKYDPSQAYMYSKQWGGHTAKHFASFSDYHHGSGGWWPPCGDEWPDMYCASLFNADNFPDGDYIGVAVNFRGVFDPEPKQIEIAYTVFEFTIDLE